MTQSTKLNKGDIIENKNGQFRIIGSVYGGYEARCLQGSGSVKMIFDTDLKRYKRA